MQPLYLAYNAAMLGTLIYAMIFGGRSERFAAALNVGASVATWLVFPAAHLAFRQPEISIWLIDLAAAIGFFAIAANSRSFWPVWAFGFALAGAACTAGRLLTDDSPFFTYYFSESAWPWAIMLTIIIGTMARRRTWMVLPI